MAPIDGGALPPEAIRGVRFADGIEDLAVWTRMRHPHRLTIPVAEGI
jgi:hypothetical protein